MKMIGHNHIGMGRHKTGPYVRAPLVVALPPYDRFPFPRNHRLYFFGRKHIPRIPMRADRDEIQPAAGIIMPLQPNRTPVMLCRIKTHAGIITEHQLLKI